MSLDRREEEKGQSNLNDIDRHHTELVKPQRELMKVPR